MPKPYQKSITIKKTTYSKAEEKSKQKYGEPNVAKFVTELIDENTRGKGVERRRKV